mmetsp:Transcript_8141/g.18172  ORF Transcript_8141/g.18172 Transcript_8141/m.18172 type:complete len:891 (+) Transcript_8141:99-2771(+)|eukprot:CAMPEP_0178457840 /NCGR_PEP_ID=MMETSP0689_2-20121128/47232_1 /TAXON_ID=160604 /ORGANISM="Amphidinium massartii, Strain CS-259" /LENGTH=890 /DNA_ID=CAMNT_0020084119 /DNA_START=88 /DNA_END=2757 /DNA_ORIENTATION=+
MRFYILLLLLRQLPAALSVRPAMDEDISLSPSSEDGGRRENSSLTEQQQQQQGRDGTQPVDSHKLSGSRREELTEHRKGTAAVARQQQKQHRAESSTSQISTKDETIIRRILEAINSDPDDLQWVWDSSAELSPDIPEYEGLRRSALEPQEALVKHLLFRHGLGMIYVSREARFEEFISQVVTTRHQSEAHEEDSLVLFARLVEAMSGWLKGELMKLSLPALQHLRAADIQWAQRDGGDWDTDQYSSYQAGQSVKVFTIIDTILQISWDDITQSDKLFVEFLKEFGSVGRDLGSPALQMAVFNAKALGDYIVPPESLALKERQEPGHFLLTGEIKFESTGFSSRFFIPLSKSEKSNIIDAAMSLSEKDGQAAMLLKVDAVVRLYNAHHMQLLLQEQWPQAIWAHELGGWIKWHPDFVKQRLGQAATISSSEDTRSSSDSDERASGTYWRDTDIHPESDPSSNSNPSTDEWDYTLAEEPGLRSSTTQGAYISMDRAPANMKGPAPRTTESPYEEMEYNEERAVEVDLNRPLYDPEPEDEGAETPLSVGKLLMYLNSDPSDLLWEWTPVTEHELETDKLKFQWIKIHGTDPAECLARHLLFRHGFALIYASRERNREAFISYLGQTERRPNEARAVFYVRVLLGFCADLLAELLQMGLPALIQLHASDSKWGILEYDKQTLASGSNRITSKTLSESADGLPTAFQATKSEKVWSLFSNGVLAFDMSQDDTAPNRAVNKFGSEYARMFWPNNGDGILRSPKFHDWMEAMYDVDGLGQRQLPHGSLGIKKKVLGTSGERWIATGTLEYPFTGWSKPIELEVSQERGEAIHRITTDAEQRMAIASIITETLEKIDKRHHELMDKYEMFFSAEELVDITGYFPKSADIWHQSIFAD